MPVLVRLLLLACLLLAAGPAAPASLVLDEKQPRVEVWPAVQVLHDPAAELDVAQVLAQGDRFAPHDGAVANLGTPRGAVWLRIPVQVPGPLAQQRVLSIDYPMIAHVDVYVVQNGQVLQHQREGSLLPRSQRSVAAHGQAVLLTLPPGASELLLRTVSYTMLLLPMSLQTPAAFSSDEGRTQAAYGVYVGLVVCMLFYSLAHWASLRSSLFLLYAVFLAGNLLLVLQYSGLGPLYLWPEHPRFSLIATQIGALIAIACTPFARRMLNIRELSPRLDQLLRVVGLAALVALAATLTGLLSPDASAVISITLGMSTFISIVPAAWMRVRRGEPEAWYMLIGYLFYAIGSAAIAGLVSGQLEPTGWVLAAYPVSNIIEMSAWMCMLGLRVRSLHLSAATARAESEALRTLAETDALTGLLNRRGLQRELLRALPQATPEQPLALYLLDLDGFKPVNDRHGHDVGDALLVGVGQRLQAQLRSQDHVARLGGDEFVVLVSGLAGEAAAKAIGEKLLAAFASPFEAAGQRCTVGATIGYAVAPFDGRDVAGLLKRADAAMYVGKQGGRLQLQRGGAAAPSLHGAVA